VVGSANLRQRTVISGLETPAEAVATNVKIKLKTFIVDNLISNDMDPTKRFCVRSEKWENCNVLTT
jgi:hypothetical protein